MSNMELQQQFLDQEAAKLNVIIRRPENWDRDRNRVQFFVEKAERPFFEFDNSDEKGRFSYDFACSGSVDLRGDRWAKRLEGAIERAYYLNEQYQYVRSIGGFANVKEADEEYDDLNYKIIDSMKKQFDELYIGCINGKDGDPVLTKLEGQIPNAMNCDFAVPSEDSDLVETVMRWRNTTSPMTSLLDAISEAVNRLNGEEFLWH